MAGSGLGTPGGLEVERVEQLGVPGDGGGEVAGREGIDDPAQLRPDPVGGHTDQADGTYGHQGQRHDVVPAVDLEARGDLCGEVRRGGGVAGGVLEGDDGGHFVGETEHGLRGDAPAAAHRDVVEHDGEIAGRLGHGAEVLEDAGLRRPVVIRGDREDAVDAAGHGLPRHGHGVRRVVGSRPGDDRDGDGLGDGAPQCHLLVIGQHRALAGRATEDKPVAPVLGQPLGQLHRRGRFRAPSSSKGVTMAVTTRPKRGESCCWGLIALSRYQRCVSFWSLPGARRPGGRPVNRRRTCPRPRWSR